MFEQIQEQLGRLPDLTTDELAELENEVLAEFDRLEAEDPSPQNVDDMSMLADALDAIRSEMEARQSEQEALSAKREELSARVHGQGEVSVEELSSDAEESDEEPDAEASSDEPEQVVAAAEATVEETPGTEAATEEVEAPEAAATEAAVETPEATEAAVDEPEAEQATAEEPAEAAAEEVEAPEAEATEAAVEEPTEAAAEEVEAPEAEATEAAASAETSEVEGTEAAAEAVDDAESVDSEATEAGGFAEPTPAPDEVDEPKAKDDESEDEDEKDLVGAEASADTTESEAADQSASEASAETEDDTLEDTRSTQEESMSTTAELEPTFSAPEDRRPVAKVHTPTSIIAAGDVPGKGVGSPFSNPRDVADGMVQRLHALRRTSGGDGEQVTVASIVADFPDDRTLHAQDPEVNWSKIRKVNSPDAMTAAGGVCVPLDVSYDIFGVGCVERPVKDALATFSADRGGIRYVKPPELSTVEGAVGFWDAVTGQVTGYDGNPTAGRPRRRYAGCWRREALSGRRLPL